MSDFVRMDGHIPIQSAAAAASLSIADANFDGVKLYNINKVSLGNQLLTWIIGMVAMAAVLMGLFAMWVEASLVTYIAFSVPLITGPWVVVQRKKLQWMPTYREESNKLRLSVNELSAKRMRLEIEVGRMGRELKRMSDIEKRFDQVVLREGKNVSEYRKLIRENTKIQAEIKKAHAAKELLDLFAVIMSTDRNEDNVVGPSEAQEFILRIRAFADRRGKLLNEALVLDAFKHSMNSPTTSHCPASMFNIVQTALSDEWQKPTAEETQNATLASEEYQPKEELVEDGFVKLLKLPRVSQTGLVLSDSKDDEGNPAHPIKIEDLMARNDMDNSYARLAPMTQELRVSFSTGSIAGTRSSLDEEEGADIVSMILKSFSDLRSS